MIPLYGPGMNEQLACSSGLADHLIASLSDIIDEHLVAIPGNPSH
jgi:hypothetical protein